MTAWHRLDVPPPGPGDAVLAQLAGKEIAVFRDEHLVLHALENSCPHQGGSLAEGVVAAGHVMCPWHGWRFELGSGACKTIPSAAVRTYRVREHAGAVEIEID